jgi:hypothetical protein
MKENKTSTRIRWELYFLLNFLYLLFRENYFDFRHPMYLATRAQVSLILTWLVRAPSYLPVPKPFLVRVKMNSDEWFGSCCFKVKPQSSWPHGRFRRCLFFQRRHFHSVSMLYFIQLSKFSLCVCFPLPCLNTFTSLNVNLGKLLDSVDSLFQNNRFTSHGYMGMKR